VDPRGAAQAAGLQIGDVLTHLGDTPIVNAMQVARELQFKDEGTLVDIRFSRKGTVGIAVVTLKAGAT
jgi:S1-C subfamily serine protease